MSFRATMIASRALLFVCALGAVLTAHPQVFGGFSSTTTIPGFAAGRDPNPDPYNTGCFTESWGAVYNACTNRTWEIALPVPNNTNSPVPFGAMVFFYSPNGTSETSCILYAVDSYGKPGGSVFIGPPSKGGGNSSNSGFLIVPAGDSAYLLCTIPPGGKVYNVKYGPAIVVGS